MKTVFVLAALAVFAAASGGSPDGSRPGKGAMKKLMGPRINLAPKPRTLIKRKRAEEQKKLIIVKYSKPRKPI